MSSNRPAVIGLHPDDNIAVAARTVAKGESVSVGNLVVISRELIELGYQDAMKNKERLLDFMDAQPQEQVIRKTA